MVNGPPLSVLGPPRAENPATDEKASDRDLLRRFGDARDQDAFGTLVARYGPMVLGVCRRVLRDPEEAEDAFQITFLVLARKAAALERPELLANYLYGVAYRAALRLRDRATRRKAREKQVMSMPDPQATDRSDGQEVLAILDEELNQLPENYRILLVLCYLQGKTHEEAARSVGCPLGSMSWRLDRARALLRKRLAHRGLVLGSMPALLLFAHTAHGAALPGPLAEATIQAAVGYATGSAAGIADGAAAVADEILQALAHKTWGGRALKFGLAALLALLAAGLIVYQVWGGDTGSMPTGGGCHP